MATVKELEARLEKLTKRRDSLIDFRNDAIMRSGDNPAYQTHWPDEPNKAEARASKKVDLKIDAAEREAKKIKVSMNKIKDTIKKRKTMLKSETSKVLKGSYRGGGGGGIQDLTRAQMRRISGADPTKKGTSKIF